MGNQCGSSHARSRAASKELDLDVAGGPTDVQKTDGSSSSSSFQDSSGLVHMWASQGSKESSVLGPGPWDRQGSTESSAQGPGWSKERYVGAYGRLLNFVEECRERQVIDSARYLDLVGAVDELGFNAQSSINSSHKFFQGTETDMVEVLPAMGIDIGHMRSSEGTCPRPSFFRSVSETDLAAVFEKPNFDARKRKKGPRGDVPLLVHGFIAHYDLISRYNIDVSTLGAWIEAVGTQYTGSNPYHNWTHAVDVFQFCHLVLFMGRAGDFFNFQDVLVLLSAALSHDVRHPGVNNAFLTNTGAPLAITYNDRSVLENMHASTFFEMLNLPGKNFLSKMHPDDFKTFRTKVIDAILATDMGIHFELVDKLTARVNKAREDREAPFLTNTKACRERQQASRSDRRMLLQIFMHQADLCNACRPWDVHKALVVALEEEFFRQGDRERELGVPIMPMMDRTKDSVAAAQGFFLGKLAGPLLDPFCSFLRKGLARCFQENLQNNKERWAALVEASGKKTARDLVALEDTSSPDERAGSKRRGGSKIRFGWKGGG